MEKELLQVRINKILKGRAREMALSKGLRLSEYVRFLLLRELENNIAQPIPAGSAGLVRGPTSSL